MDQQERLREMRHEQATKIVLDQLAKAPPGSKITIMAGAGILDDLFPPSGLMTREQQIARFCRLNDLEYEYNPRERLEMWRKPPGSSTVTE